LHLVDLVPFSHAEEHKQYRHCSSDSLICCFVRLCTHTFITTQQPYRPVYPLP
jgi:hypothetical protein